MVPPSIPRLAGKKCGTPQVQAAGGGARERWRTFQCGGEGRGGAPPPRSVPGFQPPSGWGGGKGVRHPNDHKQPRSLWRRCHWDLAYRKRHIRMQSFLREPGDANCFR